MLKNLTLKIFDIYVKFSLYFYILKTRLFFLCSKWKVVLVNEF